METTLREILNHEPCGRSENSTIGYKRLTRFLGTDKPETVVTFKQILESNGIRDAVWALRTQKYLDYCLFLADMAESVLSFYEKRYPRNHRPRACIDGIRDYKSGEITIQELQGLANAAADAAADAAACARESKWIGVEGIFIKHFC